MVVGLGVVCVVVVVVVEGEEEEEEPAAEEERERRVSLLAADSTCPAKNGAPLTSPTRLPNTHGRIAPLSPIESNRQLHSLSRGLGAADHQPEHLNETEGSSLLLPLRR